MTELAEFLEKKPPNSSRNSSSNILHESGRFRGLWKLRLMRAVTVRLPGLSFILPTRELPYERRPPGISCSLAIAMEHCSDLRQIGAYRRRRSPAPCSGSVHPVRRSPRARTSLWMAVTPHNSEASFFPGCQQGR